MHFLICRNAFLFSPVAILPPQIIKEMEPLKGLETWVFASWYWLWLHLHQDMPLIYLCLDINTNWGKAFNWGRLQYFGVYLFFFLAVLLFCSVFYIQTFMSSLVSYSSFILQPQSRKRSSGCSSIGSLPIQDFFQISQVLLTSLLLQ